MEYTIRALADLAGVTPGTLRWYDRQTALQSHLGELEARHAAGGEAGDGPDGDAALPARRRDRPPEVLRHVDHTHVGPGAAGFRPGINCHIRPPWYFSHCNTCGAVIQ